MLNTLDCGVFVNSGFSNTAFYNFALVNCLSLLSFLFPGGSDGKESAYKAGDPFNQVRKIPWKGNGNPLQSSFFFPTAVFAWRIPWTQGPGGLQFMGSQRVGHD